jgi:hypothetical protein
MRSLWSKAFAEEKKTLTAEFAENDEEGAENLNTC